MRAPDLPDIIEDVETPPRFFMASGKTVSKAIDQYNATHPVATPPRVVFQTMTDDSSESDEEVVTGSPLATALKSRQGSTPPPLEFPTLSKQFNETGVPSAQDEENFQKAMKMLEHERATKGDQPGDAELAAAAKRAQLINKERAGQTALQPDPEAAKIRESVKSFLAATVTRGTELPNRKELSDVRMQAEIKELQEKIRAIEGTGVRLRDMVVLSAGEEAKYPRNEHMKHLLLKKLKQLREKQAFVIKTQNAKEVAEKTLRRTQELYEQKMAEIAVLHQKLQDLEATINQKNDPDF